MRHFLNALAERMRVCEVPTEDELLVAVDDAADAVELLSATLDCVANRDAQKRR